MTFNQLLASGFLVLNTVESETNPDLEYYDIKEGFELIIKGQPIAQIHKAKSAKAQTYYARYANAQPEGRSNGIRIYLDDPVGSMTVNIVVRTQVYPTVDYNPEPLWENALPDDFKALFDGLFTGK